MKTLKKLFKSTLLLLVLFLCKQSYSQSDIAGPGPLGHGGGAGMYCGWDFFTGIPFDIKHELNQPIHIHTNAGFCN